MKLQNVERLAVFYEPESDHRIKVGALALKSRQILFEYDASFLGLKLELSPVRLRLTPDVVVGDPSLFDGLMGGFVASTCTRSAACCTCRMAILRSTIAIS